MTMTTLTLVGPAVAAVLLLGGWLLAQTRDEHNLPRRGLVSLGEGMASLGLLLGVLAVPTSLPPAHYAATLAAVLVVGLVLIRGAGRLAIGWTSAAEIVTSAVGLGWTRPRRAVWSLLALCAGLLLAVWLAARGEPLAGLLGVAVVLAPARWWLPWGAARERARTGVERALAGSLAGGTEWDSHEANLRGAPVRVAFDGEQRPRRVSAPLPPGWKAAAEDALRDEIRTRLDEWGRPWGVLVEHSRRRLVAERAAPLPERVSIPGTRSWGWIEAHAPSPLALYLGEGQDPASGEHRPIWWDPDSTDPHALVGGRTKSGKSVCLRLLVGQAIMRGWKVIICDPKGADFAWAGRLPGVLYFPGDEAVSGLAEACGEMDERRAWVGKHVWSGEPGSDEEPDLLGIKNHPYRPCLVILDEAAEAAGIGESDEQKQTKVNMSRLARLSRAAGIVCAFATQRPDVSFLPGETKANLGTRIMFLSDGDSTMTTMILDLALKTLGRLTAQVRGRGRVLIGGGDPVETQGAFVSVAEIKKRVGVLPPERLERVRFVAEPEWRKLLRGEPTAGATPSEDRGDEQAESEDKPSPERGKRPSKKRDGAKTVIEQNPDPEPGEDRTPNADKPHPTDEDKPHPTDEVDPLDFFGDD